MLLRPLAADAADVIERKVDPKTGKWRYYVHYLECECPCKRLPAWRGRRAGGWYPLTAMPAPPQHSVSILATSSPFPGSVDKRLDEWVGQERVGSIAKAASADALHRVASGGSGDLGGDQKMTRRLKRQYTEILHVPAALEELPPIDQASRGRRAGDASRHCYCASARDAASCWRGSPTAGVDRSWRSNAGTQLRG